MNKDEMKVNEFSTKGYGDSPKCGISLSSKNERKQNILFNFDFIPCFESAKNKVKIKCVMEIMYHLYAIITNCFAFIIIIIIATKLLHLMYLKDLLKLKMLIQARF